MRVAKVILIVVALSILVWTGLVRLYMPEEDSKQVVIYTTQWCGYCAALRSSLISNQIPYREYDVEKSLRGAVGFIFLGGRGVPVSVLGPEIVYGYDAELIDQRLHALGYQTGGED